MVKAAKRQKMGPFITASSEMIKSVGTASKNTKMECCTSETFRITIDTVMDNFTAMEKLCIKGIG